MGPLLIQGIDVHGLGFYFWMEARDKKKWKSIVQKGLVWRKGSVISLK